MELVELVVLVTTGRLADSSGAYSRTHVTLCNVTWPIRTIADHSLFREPSYQALTSPNAARRADLGTYRA